MHVNNFCCINVNIGCIITLEKSSEPFNSCPPLQIFYVNASEWNADLPNGNGTGLSGPFTTQPATLTVSKAKLFTYTTVVSTAPDVLGQCIYQVHQLREQIVES